MQREEFFMSKFSLKNRQDVTVKFKNDGKTVTEEFTEAVHPGLYKALTAFDEVVKKQTGLNSDKNGNVESIESRTVHTFDGSDSRSLMITVVVKWKGGYSNSINTCKMPVDKYSEITGLNVEALILELEDRVFGLLFEGEQAQQEIPFEK